MANDWKLNIDWGKLPTVMNRLRALEGLKRGLRAAMLHLKGVADDYPPKKYVSRKEAYGASFFSDVQRKAFFAQLNSGEIQVPYVRKGSGGLAGKWGIREENDGLTQALGNNAPYAGEVVGPKQNRMMALIGWRKVRDVMQAEKAALQRIIREQIQRDVSE